MKKILTVLPIALAFIATTVLISTLATSTVAAAEKDADLQRVQDNINKDKKPKGAVRTDSEHGRVSVESKSGKGVYVEGGGKAADHNNPKGEAKVGAGVQIRLP